MRIQPQNNDIFIRIQVAKRKNKLASSQIINPQRPSPQGNEGNTLKDSPSFQ